MTPRPGLLANEAAAGSVLIASAALALVVANSPAASAYAALLHAAVGPMSVAHWVNDGLMALFFLLIGLEIKRELVGGELATWRARVLPGAAALGGMIVPALIYLAVNRDDATTLRGWAIPTATDIAFALGVVALLGRRVPASLKIFLTALAILDDLGAVAIIALFYTAGLTLPWLAAAAGLLATGVALNRLKVVALWPYLLLGAILWYAVLRSGVHPTLAGVALAMVVPIGAGDASPLHRLEHALQPWVAFLVVPVFGFANAGVTLAGVPLDALAGPLPLGIAAGLFVGKQVGVFGAARLAIGGGWAARPAGASFAQLYGVALLCGIGFTMSLFIGLLAFPATPLVQDEMRIAILAGSIGSALAGAAVLAVAGRRRASSRPAGRSPQ